MIVRAAAAVGTALAVMLAAGVAGSAWVDARASALREDARRDLSAQAGRLADALDTGMYGHWRDILDLAAADAGGSDAASQRIRRDALNQLKGRQPEWAWIGYASPDGTVTASTDGILEGQSVAQREWFVRGATAPVVLDLHEARLLARFLKRDGDAPPRLLDIASPRPAADGAARGVLGAHLSWGWARGVERAVRAELAPGEGTEFLVVSSAGDVLLGPSAAEPRLDIPGGTWTDGYGRLSAAVATRGRAEYPGLGWSVVARRDERAITAPAAALGRYALAGGLPVALVLGAGAFALAGRRRA